MAKPRYSQADRELERRVGDLEARIGEVVVDSAVDSEDDLDLYEPDFWTQELLVIRIAELEDKIDSLKAWLDDTGNVVVRTVNAIERIDPEAHRALLESLRQD